MATINKLNKLADRLTKLIKSAEGLPRVSVGFLAGASYPETGISVATVAAINEFGNPDHNQPPRPFFRLMIAENSHTWGGAVALNMKATDNDVPKTLERMGLGIKGQLQQSIKTLVDPPLAPSTVKKKGFDKPLIDTSVMLNAVDYRVDLT